ncbi:MAG TPA: hypothetical protein ENK50_09415, partial [Sedimenticola sp.]|nr:hypothetical protein [Sedimenticola sp.]
MTWQIYPAPRLLAVVLVQVWLLLVLPAALAEGGNVPAGSPGAGREPAKEASDAPGDVQEEMSQLSIDKIKSHIAELEAISAPDPATKVALELYQNTLAQLLAAERAQTVVAGYRKLIAEAGSQKAQIKARLEQLKAQGVEPLPAGEALDLKGLEHQLDQAQSERRLLQEKLSELQTAMTTEKRRPDEIIKELAQAKLKLDEVEAQLLSKIFEGDDIVARARYLLQQATRAAIKAQISRLEMERLSHNPRLELMKLREQLLQAQLAQATARIKRLQEALNTKRVSAAAAAARQAVEVKQGSSSKLPLIQAEAEKNAQLGRQLRKMAAELARTTREKELEASQVLLLGRNMERSRQQMDIAGMDQSLGEVLRTQRKELPSLKLLKKQAAKTRGKSADVRLQQFLIENRLQALLNGEYRNHLLEVHEEALQGMDLWQRSQLQQELGKLLQDRIRLLQQLRDLAGRYEKVLGDLELEQQQMLSKVEQYADLLDRNLFWMPSAPTVNRDILKDAFKGLTTLASPKWMRALEGFSKGFLQHPLRGGLLYLT